MSTVYDESRLREVQNFFNVSGCGLNTFRQAPPKANPVRMEGKEDGLSSMPQIHLMNFEDPTYEESKYVLTSPRSLEACSRLGVKPVDLLYKPLAEFQEELLPQEVPLRTIYNIYDEHEQNRERKLALCREERDRIMNEEQGKPVSRRPAVQKSKRPVTSASTKRKQKLTGKKALSKSDQNLNVGSMQRQRTAWTTSVGHTRVSNDEINNRVKELHDESMKLRKELLSRKESRSMNREKGKPKSRPGTARPATARAAKKSAPLARSFSASDLSLAGTSMLNRTGLKEAKPITNTKLRKALKPDVRDAVTPRDEKILELMMLKHEDERSVIKEKYLREIVWERQKKEEEAAKLLSEMRRRRMIAEENRIKDMRKDNKAAQRKKDEERLVELQEKILNDSRRKWETRYATQQKSKDFKVIEKVQKDKLKKRIQENNLKSLEMEEEEIKSLVKEKQQHQLMTAAQKKEARLLEESLRVMMTNRSERRKFEDRWSTMLEDTKSTMEALAASMEVKDDQHKSKYEQVLRRKENEIMLNRLDREKKQLQAKLSQQQQETEMEEWRDNILTAREMAERHAQETMAQTIERRARKAHEDRLKKEKEQKKNIKRIHQDIDEWKKEMENVIETKDVKSSTIMKEKELTIQQSRSLAASSQKLRDTLRNKYGGESFDQMAFKAEMYNKFETGNTFLSANKNTSHVKIH